MFDTTSVETNVIGAEVVANLPTAKPGVVRQAKFKSMWKYIDDEQLQQLISDVKDGRVKNREVIEEYLVELPDMGAGGQIIPFQDAKAWLQKNVAAANAAVSSFFAAVNGVKVKN